MIKKIIYFFVINLFLILPEDCQALVITKLKNDVKVVLKQTSFDPGEIYIKMIASEGEAVLPIQFRQLAQLSAETALEVAFKDLVDNQFFDDDIELEVSVTPYSRQIDGFSITDEIDTLLKCVKDYFTVKQFSQEALDETKSNFLRELEGVKKDQNHAFQEKFFLASTHHFLPFTSHQAEAIQKADLKIVQEVFHRLFGSVSDFTLVIVGDFDETSMLSKLEQTIGMISQRTSALNLAPIPQFPIKKITEEIPVERQKTVLARFAFPLKLLNPEVYVSIKVIREFLERKLIKQFKKDFNDDFGVEVSYENPIYPRLEIPFLVIQYRSDLSSIKSVQSAIIEEIQNLCKTGISQKEWDEFKDSFVKVDLFWLRNNQLMLSLLSQYSLSHWEIKESTGSSKEVLQVNLEQANKVIKNILCHDSYIFLYSKF